MRLFRHFYFLILFSLYVLNASCSAQDKMIDLLSGELKREMSELKKQQTPPFYISYVVTETKSFWANAAFGALTGSDKTHTMHISISVRVGNYDLDNTHEIRGDRYAQYQNYNNHSAVEIPIDLSEVAIKNALWRETNRLYNQAVEQYSKVKANVAVKVKEGEKTEDFSKEKTPEVYYEAPLNFDSLLSDRSYWEKSIRNYSRLFLKEQDIFTANSYLRFEVIRKYMVTTEGTSLVHNLTYTNLYVNSVVKSPDGMEMPLYKSYFAFLPSGLPGEGIITSDIEKMIQKLEQLHSAPEVNPYTGPAILTGRAASVFFHEIFGHRVEAQRMKNTEDAQTFRKKINEKVLPEQFSVIFDPFVKDYKSQQLSGYYKFDDEGIKPQRVTIVENGILKNFLASRSPLDNIKYSNGHGRGMLGSQPVTRQSNMLIQSNELLSMKDLRNRLIEECKKQGKEFGLLFDDVIGGFTMTGRYVPNAFNVTPTLVYKVYVDGRPDELVRGVDLVGTPLTVFSNISQAGDEFGVFNGYCGAESGSVPVGCAAPALLVSQIEVQKKIKSQERPPILARPDLEKPQ